MGGPIILGYPIVSFHNKFDQIFDQKNLLNLNDIKTIILNGL